MSIHTITLLIASALFISSCSSNVLYGSPSDYQNDGFASKNNPTIFRVAFDRDGTPYPARDVGEIPPDNFELAKLGSRICQSEEVADCEAKSSKRINIMAGKILHEINKHSKRTLFITVHGFNTSYKEVEDSYEKVRQAVDERATGIVHLHVYWDGLMGAQWAKASYNSGEAGIGLRKLLNELESTSKANGSSPIKYRFLTHSRGADVATSALWNSWKSNSISNGVRQSIFMRIKAFLVGRDIDEDFKSYDNRACKVELPNLEDVRIALLAPAIGCAPMIYYAQQLSLKKIKNPISINIGWNKDDEIVKKFLVGASNAGDTNLATTPRECLTHFDNQKPPSLTEFVGRAHGFDRYIESDGRKAAFGKMLDALLD